MGCQITMEAQATLRNTRRVIADLRPALLDDLGFALVIGWYGEQRLNPLGIGLRLQEVGGTMLNK